ncbi:hypothetical protein [Chondromyces crocatus]|uniref:Uncharacterized protein n=1 Tax=Chondromyces crocatus TaxID=52 RepID=A0A0K1EPD3_CHOCO|nr:hypothetical protein [Chondromyces crocatus]AKT42775.1 uncharacterized protein CMC5_070020 [Chondromyces crocatus]
MSSFQSILERAQPADYEFLIAALKSPVNFSSDASLHRHYEAFQRDPCAAHRAALARQIEREIRYLGSADLAYFFRWLTRREPGVPLDDLLDAIAQRLGVKLKPIGTPRSRLECLVRAVVEQAVLDLSEDQQRALFRDRDLGPAVEDELLRHLKSKGRVALLVRMLGQDVVEKLVPGLVLSTITPFLGREAAGQLMTRLAARFPLWAEWLGPVLWGVTAAWLTIDLQSPAFRKTTPAILYCGLISLRDGPEEGLAFWQATDDDEA